jgi:DNA-binding NtrC family response regulator
LQLKILVVDDEKNIREGLGQALEYEDYKVELAADGKEAIAIVNQGGVDLVVTDLRMPRMGGEELLASVTSSNPNLPVIVLTGHGTVENAVAAMRNGAYDFLTKPVNLDRLNLLIKRALGKP